MGPTRLTRVFPQFCPAIVAFDYSRDARKPGEVVKRGQVLAILDPTFSEVDLGQIQRSMHSINEEIRRLRAEFDGLPYSGNGEPDSATDGSLQKAMFDARQAEHSARMRTFAESTARLDAALVTNRREQTLLKEQIDVVSEMVAMRKKLLTATHGSRLGYLVSMDRYKELSVDLERGKNREKELSHEILTSQSEREAFRTSWRNQIGARLMEAIRQRNRLFPERTNAQRVNDLVVLRAIADAVVLEVQDKSAGSVVQQAETLFTLVRLDAPLEAEIELPTREIGWVKVGDVVRLKLEAFPFQRYGTLSGRLTTVSPDTVISEMETQPGVRQSVYRTKIEISENNLHGVPKNLRLSPGMEVAADIKVGRRRVIAYFLDPLLKGLDESIREPR